MTILSLKGDADLLGCMRGGTWCKRVWELLVRSMFSPPANAFLRFTMYTCAHIHVHTYVYGVVVWLSSNCCSINQQLCMTWLCSWVFLFRKYRPRDIVEDECTCICFCSWSFVVLTCYTKGNRPNVNIVGQIIFLEKTEKCLKIHLHVWYTSSCILFWV